MLIENANDEKLILYDSCELSFSYGDNRARIVFTDSKNKIALKSNRVVIAVPDFCDVKIAFPGYPVKMDNLTGSSCSY